VRNSVDFHTIAIKYGTPVYIYDGNTILKNCRTVLETFDDLDLIPTFALKANSNPNIVRLINSTGFGADVVSKGELLASLKAGVPPFKIVWNGTGKKISDMEYFLSIGVGFINVDSFEEMDRWLEMMKHGNKSTIKFLVRVNPDVDAHTHPHISTGLKENKFGIDISEFDRFMSKFGDYISGIHVHIGSQITEVEPFVETYEQIISLLMKYDLEYFNLGGGWGIDYGDGKHLNLDEYKERVIPILKEFSGKFLLELGRFIVGNAGYLLLRVVEIKRKNRKTFIVVDGGMNLLLRPALYDAHHEITTIDGTGIHEVVDVVGPLCESGDFLGKDLEVELPKVGGLILVENCGAYGFSMSSNYNSLPKPPEVLILNGEDFLIRRRESDDEIFIHVVEMDSNLLKGKIGI